MVCPSVVVHLLDGAEEYIEAALFSENSSVLDVKLEVQNRRGHLPGKQQIFVDGIDDELPDQDLLCELSAHEQRQLAFFLLLNERANTVNECADEIAKSYSDHMKPDDVKPLNVIDYDARVRIVLLGDSGVGKTSLVMRMTEDVFITNCHLYNFGVDFRIKTLRRDSAVLPRLQDCLLPRNFENIKCQIWDTAGAERFRPMQPGYYRGAGAFAVVFDVTDRSSFLQTVLYWKKQILQYSKCGLQAVLVGTKSDLAGIHSPLDNQDYEPLPHVCTLLPRKAKGKGNGKGNDDEGNSDGAQCEEKKYVANEKAQTEKAHTDDENNKDFLHSTCALSAFNANPYEHMCPLPKRQVSVEEAEFVAKAWGVPYVEVSSKSGTGARAALCALVEAAVQQHILDSKQEKSARVSSSVLVRAPPSTKRCSVM